MAFSDLIAPLATVRNGLVAAAGAAAMLVACMAWDRLIDDPAVRREALRGYVVRVELEAAEAKAAEAERQRIAGAAALADLAERLRMAEAASVAADEAMERAIAGYEARLAAEGRACLLTPPDIDFLKR